MAPERFSICETSIQRIQFPNLMKKIMLKAKFFHFSILLADSSHASSRWLKLTKMSRIRINNNNSEQWKRNSHLRIN